MVKQTKKGSIGKKALSAILAASMIMTSSSFVMAGPVVEEVENVATAAVVEEVDASEENVGEIISEANVTVEGVTYAAKNLADDVKITVKNAAGDVLVKGTDYTISYLDAATKAVVAEVKNAGSYIAKITFKGSYEATDAIEKTFTVAPYTITNAKVTYVETGYRYNGQKQFPTPTVTVADAPAEVKGEIGNALEVVPYNESYDMISAGAQKIKLALKEDVKNYTLANEIGAYEYAIDKGNSYNVTVEAEDVAYTGNTALPNIVVKDKVTGKTVDSSTYSVKYLDQTGKEVVAPTKVDTYTIVVTSNGNGNFINGLEARGTYKIVNANLAMAAKSATVEGTTKVDGVYTLVYDGTAHTFTKADIAIPGLTQGVDYEVVTDSVEVKEADDTAVITLKGINKFNNDTATLNIKVLKKEINTTDFAITAKASKGVSDKDHVILTIMLGDKELKKGTDYTVESIDPAKKTIVIKGKDNYTTATKDDVENAGLEIAYTESTKILMDDARIDVPTIADVKWTGSQITPVVGTVTDKTVIPHKTLEKGKDYTVTYGENINTGVGTVTLTGMGDYEGTRVIEFNITGTNLVDTYKLAPMSDVTLDEAKAGNGKVTPKLVYQSNEASAPASVTYEVKYYSDSAYSKEITDFVAFANTIDITKGSVPVYVKATGTGKYSGFVTRSYNIVEGEKLFVDAVADQQYTGKAIEPTVVVKDKNGVVLVKDKDYTVSYLNNVKVGVAYINVKGIGKYAGTQVIAFNIVGEMEQEIAVLPAQEKALQNRTLNDKATKVKYTKDLETSVTYASSNEDVVTVDAEGNIKYTGLGEATITIKTAAENGYKESVKELKVVVRLKQPTFTPSSRNNAFTVTTSTVKGAEQFQVQYVPTGKSFNNAAAKTKTFTVDNKLKKGKVSAANKETYRVRVRAISGDHKSKWSPVKTIATL